MAWTWTNTAVAGEKAKAALITELQNAIKQLAADIFISPANGNDGNGDLSKPLQKSWRAGDSTTNGASGRTITFGTAEADTNYSILITFTADPGANVGAVWYTKATGGFTVYNIGDTGKAFSWCLLRHQNA